MGNFMELLGDTTACRLLKNSSIGLFAVIMLFVSCTKTKTEEKEVLPFYNTADFDAEWINESDPNYAKIHTISDFQFQNQEGKTTTNDSLEGKIYVANFFFSICPSVCPKMMGNLKTLNKTFADNQDVKIVSFSVMPWIDSVAVLKKYSKKMEINASNWYLLTGDKEKIYTLARQSYFAEKGLGVQKSAEEFLHTESMLLIDKKGRIRGIYNSTQKVDIERVTDDINVLLLEK
jgi:protein SCO1